MILVAGKLPDDLEFEDSHKAGGGLPADLEFEDSPMGDIQRAEAPIRHRVADWLLGASKLAKKAELPGGVYNPANAINPAKAVGDAAEFLGTGIRGDFAQPGGARKAIRGGLQGFYGELGDEAQAGLETAVPGLAQTPAAIMDGDAPPPARDYRENLLRARGLYASEAGPAMSAGKVAGGVMRDTAVPKLLGGTAKPAWYALMGGVEGLGGSEEDLRPSAITPEAAVRAGVRTGVGAGLGYGGAKVGQAIGRGAQSTGEKLDTFGNRKAVEALNPSKKQFGQILDRGTEDQLGDAVWRKKIVTPWASLEEKAKRAATAADESGAAVGGVLKDIDAAAGGPKFEIAPAVSRFEQDSMSKMMMPGAQGPVVSPPLKADYAAAAEQAQELKGLAPQMSFAKANDLKGQYTNKARAFTDSATEPEKVSQFRQLYGIINSEMENQVPGATKDPGLLGAFRKTKSEHGLMRSADDMASDAFAATRGRNAQTGIGPVDAIRNLLGHSGRGPAMTAAVSKGLGGALMNNTAFMTKWGGQLGRASSPIIADYVLSQTNPEYVADKERALSEDTTP